MARTSMGRMGQWKDLILMIALALVGQQLTLRHIPQDFPVTEVTINTYCPHAIQVKPTNNTHLNGALGFHGNSIYRKSYMPRAGGPENLARWTNHFKNGEPWLGNTTYRENFRGPNTDEYNSNIKAVQKRDIDPDFGHQYGIVRS